MLRKVYIIQAGLGCAHLIEYDSGLVLVDAGSRGNERKILRRIRSLGRDDLRFIFITHAHLDHYGSAAPVDRRPHRDSPRRCRGNGARRIASWQRARTG